MIEVYWNNSGTKKEGKINQREKIKLEGKNEWKRHIGNVASLKAWNIFFSSSFCWKMKISQPLNCVACTMPQFPSDHWKNWNPWGYQKENSTNGPVQSYFLFPEEPLNLLSLFSVHCSLTSACKWREQSAWKWFWKYVCTYLLRAPEAER